MLGNFTYCNPTRLHFGDDALEHLAEELKLYGENVLLTYGAVRSRNPDSMTM